MSNPSTQQETSPASDDDRPAWVLSAVVATALTAIIIGPGMAIDYFSGHWNDESPFRAEVRRGVNENIQKWNQAHKDLAWCDFGNGVRFQVWNKEPADVPEAIRPALTAGLATGACRPAVLPLE